MTWYGLMCGPKYSTEQNCTPYLYEKPCPIRTVDDNNAHIKIMNVFVLKIGFVYDGKNGFFTAKYKSIDDAIEYPIIHKNKNNDKCPMILQIDWLHAKVSALTKYKYAKQEPNPKSTMQR